LLLLLLQMMEFTKESFLPVLDGMILPKLKVRPKSPS
jgi:hypothetical protein